MEKYVIVTAGKTGRYIYSLMKNFGFIKYMADNDSEKWGKTLEGDIKIVSIISSVNLYKTGEIRGFLFPAGLAHNTRYDLCGQLCSLGVKEEDIKVVLEEENRKIYLKNIAQTVSLPYLEIPVVEHCNLNCKGCSHFSPIAPHKEYDIKKFKDDINKLKTLVDTISLIRIMGGEPLLCERLADFICETRRVYPEAEVRIVTNGLLLKKMPDEFWNVIRENNVVVQITLYPLLFEKEDELVDILKKEKVFYIIDRTSRFRKPIHLKSRKVYKNLPKDWDRCRCTNLYDGKISPCAMVMFVERFNKKFGCSYSDEGIIDLYAQGLTGEKLVGLLGRSIPFCDYCELFTTELSVVGKEKENIMAWETVKQGNERIEDWVY